MNPFNYIDISFNFKSTSRKTYTNGIYVENWFDRRTTLRILKETFGTNKGFYFDKDHRLRFDFRASEHYLFMNDERRHLFAALDNAMNQNNRYVTVSYVESYRTIRPGATKLSDPIPLNGALRSGGAYIPWDNAIYIWDKKTLTTNYSGETKTYYQNQLFWHELGHFLKPSHPGYAIILENYMRAINGISPRNFDDEHPPYP